jgi:ribosomal protein S18 acetylase RimI-like enzyme
MIVAEQHKIGILNLGETDSPHQLELRAKQLSQFMRRAQLAYAKNMGVARIDPDPLPDPRNASEIAWRVGRLRESGQLQLAGLEYLAAYKLTQYRQPGSRLTSIQGLLVLGKPEGLCGPDGHKPTEIIEWNVDNGRQHKGLGRLLLRAGMDAVHPEDDVVLDVAEHNPAAIAIYEHYGFTRDESVAPVRHGVFDTQHLRYQTQAADLQARLNP